MAINQKRVYDLTTYTQLEAGDVGYIPATSVWIAVDYNGWSEAKKITLDNFLSSFHIEAGRLSSLSSRSVSLTFGTAFSGTVVDSVKVYREVDVTGTKTVRQDVLYYDLAVTTTGFTLEIDSSESLTGVIVDYKMMEAQ